MRHFGIIGKPLGHSYSEQYFTEKFAREGIAATYQAYAIDTIGDVYPLLRHMDGFNVTYPYKEVILPLLEGVDPIAEKIGAVNVVYRGKGYNTDWIGFQESLQPLLQDQDCSALLLGTGGVSKAIQYALQRIGITYTLVSRVAHAQAISYEQVDEHVLAKHTIVINCTPLGMHPFENKMPPLPYQYIGKEHLLYDCIYNPEKTLFLQQAIKQGCRIKNGLEMLHRQADQAWQIWNRI